MIQDLTALFTRDLNKLRDEISKYPDEPSIWAVRGGITNSAGNLCLHLVGNLNHFIGAVLGGNGYVRDRDAEFSLKNIPRERLVADIDRTAGVVTAALSSMTDADLNKPFPVEVLGRTESTAFMLIHFLAHFNYHLGQVNYHRRLTAG
jgi:uncharacterized damage-inducible protein DinB